MSESFPHIRSIILDRDGVLNEELPDCTPVSEPTLFRWLPGALGGLADLRSLGLRISVATNQSAIGRGLLSEVQLEAVHTEMLGHAASTGGSIDAVFFCPHRPDEGCRCRKPAPGLIAAAIAQSGFSANETLVVGDDRRDIDAARRAGAHAALLRTGKGVHYESIAALWNIPVFDNLSALAASIANSLIAHGRGAST
jgi:D-glycero-D-manno-heptose 1,7-bisphosphate phosphatase